MKACKDCKFWTKKYDNEYHPNKLHPKTPVVFNGKGVGGCHHILRSGCVINKTKYLDEYSTFVEYSSEGGFTWLWTLEDFYCRDFKKK